jgi:hypothetical protein
LWHVDVDQDDIGYEQIGLLNGHLPIRRLANDEDIRLSLQAPANAAAEKRVIIDDQNLNAIHSRTPSLC